MIKLILIFLFYIIPMLILWRELYRETKQFGVTLESFLFIPLLFVISIIPLLNIAFVFGAFDDDSDKYIITKKK